MRKMADFTQSNATKTAVRKIAEPLPDVTAFDNIVLGVITNNPFQCVSYNAAGVSHSPVERYRESYTAKVNYEDTNAKIVGSISIKTGTIAAYTAVANRIMADATIATAMGGTPDRDTDHETYSASLRCHDANGEIYFVYFSRNLVSLTSYSDEAIRTKVETWADTVGSLA
jgi:hypothetical protein